MREIAQPAPAAAFVCHTRISLNAALGLLQELPNTRAHVTRLQAQSAPCKDWFVGAAHAHLVVDF